MALQKAKTLSTGAVAEYHKIYRININWHDKNSEVVMVSYVDQGERENGASFFGDAVVNLSFNGDDFPFTSSGNNQEQAYDKIKESKLDEEGNETNFFADALNV